MKILMIGMNGFLGRNLSEIIKHENFEILSLVRKINFKPKKFKIIRDDISNLKNKNFEKIKKFKPDVVVNLAWSGIPDYSFKNSLKNFMSHINFFEKIKDIESIKKYIMVGSSWEYYPNKGKCSEKNKINFSSPFSWSKSSIYKHINQKIINKRTSLIWFRVFFMYGKYQKKKSLIPHIISNLKRNKRPKILTPNVTNDFIHVDDVCEAIILSIKKKNMTGIFNIGFGKSIMVSDIYNLILKKLDKKEKKYKLSSKNIKNNKNNYANIKKISLKLNWRPKIDINNGINKLLKFKSEKLH